MNNQHTAIKNFFIILSISILFISIFIGLCSHLIHKNNSHDIALKNIPLLEDEVSKLKFYTYNFDTCYGKNSIEFHYIYDVIHGTYEAPRFLSAYDQHKIFELSNICDKKIKNMELVHLKNMNNQELINLQKKSLSQP